MERIGMERIDCTDDRIVALAAALARPPARDAGATASAPADPRAALEAERVRVLEAAREEGRAAGLREADARIERRAAEAERKIQQRHAAETARLAESRERLARLLRAVPDAVADVEAQLEDWTVEAAFAATTRVLGEFAADRAWVARLCEQVLREYRQRPAVLRVAPADLAMLQALAGTDGLRVEADAGMAPGDCRVESAKGRYESGLAARLDAIKHAFLASLADGDARP